MKNSILSNIVFAQITAALAFLVVPAFIISQAPQEFAYLDYPIFLSSGLLFTIILGGALSIILALLHGLRLHNLANSFSLFGFAWVVIAGFILPVCVSAGMVDPELIRVDILNLAIVALTSFCLAAFASTTFKKNIVIFLSFVIASALISSIFSIYSYIDDSVVSTRTDASNKTVVSNEADASNNHFSLSKRKNIFVVSFDGLPGGAILDLIKKNAIYSTTFKDFKFFDNAISQSPATAASIMGEVYGVQDYKSMGESQSDVNQTLKNKFGQYLLTNFVEDSYVYGPYTESIPKRINLRLPANDSQDGYFEKVQTFDFFRYSIVRLATSEALIYTDWSATVESIKNYLIPLPENLALVVKMQNHVGPKWDRQLIADIKKYDYWVDNLTVSDKEFSNRYVHFTFTHYPVDFDSTCAFRSDDMQWYENHQNLDGIYGEEFCALSKFADFIHKLKSLGIYEQSLVVLKSDHGKPVKYFSKSPDNLRINSHPNWGYNRYRPTLMIKDFNANNQEMAHPKELVLLNDLAQTLCKNSGLEIRCDHFHGTNLLSEEVESFDEPYYIYVVKDSESSHNFVTHASVKIPSRKAELVKSMEASDLITLSPLN